MKFQNPGGRDRRVMSSKQPRLDQETLPKVEEEEGEAREREGGEEGRKGKEGKIDN